MLYPLARRRATYARLAGSTANGAWREENKSSGDPEGIQSPHVTAIAEVIAAGAALVRA
jgi:hypothetical protein